jgi:hypothetical protein
MGMMVLHLAVVALCCALRTQAKSEVRTTSRLAIHWIHQLSINAANHQRTINITLLACAPARMV